MQIIYIGAFRFPIYDAAAARVLNIARAFRDNGHTVRFISWGGCYCEEDKDENGIYKYDKFEYYITDELDLKGSILDKITTLFHKGKKSLEVLKNINDAIDLVIAYNADYRLTKTLLSFCNARGIKFANDITEWYEPHELYFFERVPYYLNMKSLQHKVKNKIVISSYLNYYFEESNNLLLPPLCDPSEKKWSKTVVDERIESFDGVTLFYAGTPAKKDCVHNCINVINRLANEGKKVRFIILGITKEVYLCKYADKLDDKSLNDAILFLGRVSQQDIPAYYKYADFMVLLREPTRKNMAGFPTKVAESITAGIPVITNNTSDLSKYINEGKTGFILEDEKVETLYRLLKTKVLAMDQHRIDLIKRNVRTNAFAFNCHCYKTIIERFLNNLK